jgi:DNA-binding winged helix-turn-helix (wHTH) protein
MYGVSGPMYFFDDYELNPRERLLLRSGAPVALTPKAFDTLVLLVENHGHMVSKDALMRHLWPGSFVEENNLSQNISLLRRSLKREDGSAYIETVPKSGYRFVCSVRTATLPAVATGPAAAAPALETAFSVPETKYARSGDINIAYQVIGDGPVDLLFVMGWLSHLEYFWTEPSFARFLRKLASFSRLILFDKRGTGLSDRVPVSELPTLEQRMDDVRAVLQAVGSRHAVLCGVSEGGPMSALFAASYPEKTRALIMIGTYAKRIRSEDYPWGPTEEQRQAFLDEIGEHWGSPVGLEERAPSVAGDPHFREWWATYLRMCASPGAAIALTKMNSQVDVREILPSVRVPSLVIHRTGDVCLTVEEGRYVASRIPGSTFVEVPGVDHLPFVGDQDPILFQIEQFLNSVRYQQVHDRVLATILAIRINGPAETVRRFLTQANREVEWLGGRTYSRTAGLASFDGPARAIRCARSLVEHAASAGLAVAAGLHTGECDTAADTGISGLPVEIAAAIAAQAPPGQVVVSHTVRDLVAGANFRFEDCGSLAFDPSIAECRLLTVG